MASGALGAGGDSPPRPHGARHARTPSGTSAGRVRGALDKWDGIVFRGRSDQPLQGGLHRDHEDSAEGPALEAAIQELLAEGLGNGGRLAEIGRLGVRLVQRRAVKEEVTAFLGRARSERRAEAARVAEREPAAPGADAEGELEIQVLQIRRAAACLAKDLPALRVHLEYPLRLRKRLRSTNLLERSLEEVKQRTEVIGRFPGETRCLSLCWAVLDLFTASARWGARRGSRGARLGQR